MAAKKGAVSKSAGLDELKADLKAETLKNAYIFYGEETYLRQSYLDQVREALVPAGFEEFNYHRLGGKGLSMQALQEAVEAMPMMAQHTLVTVTDLDIFKLDMSARGAFIEIISDIPEYCTVIFIYDLVAYKRDGKMKKLVAALDEHVREVEFCQQAPRAAAALDQAPLRRRRPRHRRGHGRPPALHLRLADDRPPAGDREGFGFCEGAERHHRGYQRRRRAAAGGARV